jgi:threonine dehydratase
VPLVAQEKAQEMAIDTQRSTITVHVGKSGLLSAAAVFLRSLDWKVHFQEPAPANALRSQSEHNAKADLTPE